MTGYGEVYYGVHEAAVNYPVAGNVGAGAYRVSIQKKGYSGAATALLIGAHSQVLKQEPEKKQKFFKYSSTALSFQFIEQDVLSLHEFYTEDDREWCLEYTRDSNLIYRGWVFGQNIKQFYFNEKYSFEITATDGLKELDKIPFTDTDGLPFATRLTCLEVLAQINRLVGLELPISTVMSVYEASQGQGDTDNVLTVIKPDQQRFLDENGNAKTCKEVLDDLCVLFGANLFQNDGVLCFERWNAEAEGATNRINYDKLGAYISNTALVNSYEISKDTSHAAIWPTVEVDMEPAYEEVVVDYVYKAGSYLAGNSLFTKVNFGGGTASTDITISATDGYIYTKKTLATFGGWTAFGDGTVSQIIFNDTFKSYINKGAAFFGFAPDSYVRITKGTQLCGLKSDPNYIKKDSTIGFKVGANYVLKNVGSVRFGIKLTAADGTGYWYNLADNGWVNSNTTTPVPIDAGLAPFWYQTPVGFPVVVNTAFLTTRKYFVCEVSKAVPADGYIEFYLYHNPNAADTDFHIFDIKILSSTALSIETERHAANNLKKYTKVPEAEVLSFSDETMGYLPSTLWKGDKLAGSFVKKAGLVPYKLVDLAVETVFEQYHRPGMIVYLDYLGLKLNIGQRVALGATIFPELGGKTWKVIDNRKYCFETMEGACTMHEVFTDFVEYDRNNQVLDKDGKTIHIQSDRIETEETAIANSILPWTWDEIPIFDFVTINNNNSLTIAGNNSYYPVTVDWGNGTSQTYATSGLSYSKNYGSNGNRNINISFSNPDAITSITIGGVLKIKLNRFPKLTAFNCDGNYGQAPVFIHNNPLLEVLTFSNAGTVLFDVNNFPVLRTLILHNLTNSSADINAYLAALRIKWAGNYSGKVFTATGLTAAPTGQGLTDKAYMQGLGATITTN